MKPKPEQEWKRYRKIATVWAKQMDNDFTVETPEGVMQGKAGDYLVMDEERTHSWPVKREVFERTYICVEKEKDWRQRAEELEEFKATTKEQLEV